MSFVKYCEDEKFLMILIDLIVLNKFQTLSFETSFKMKHNRGLVIDSCLV